MNAAGALPEWPQPPPSSEPPVGRLRRTGRPERPHLPAIFCSTGGTEMSWSTFQRNVRDSVAPHALRPGPWEGEFQCSANTCAGNHLAAAEPIDVPRLWRRAPAPAGALPECSSCQSERCIPILFNSFNVTSGQNPWSAQWQCYACGIQTREVVETSADA